MDARGDKPEPYVCFITLLTAAGRSSNSKHGRKPPKTSPCVTPRYILQFPRDCHLSKVKVVQKADLVRLAVLADIDVCIF